ncbi:hypothetical protein [Chryseobacterium daeguense]|uniref:hypothetical protein n=1 Tax=Chryseobacterium daeguense TaxID=412438 RepID=UPI00048A2A38|nr:hypothetical protein [Chryseobacterium daeguense]
MANNSICTELTGAIDKSCVRNFPKKYYQEAVIINLNDIDKANSQIGNIAGSTCDYTVQMILKSLKKGVQVKLPETGNAIKGFTGKSKTDNGFVQYLHQVQILMIGADVETKCQIDKLDHGRYVVALQLTDGTVEIYGWENGLSTGDYTYDIAEGGGGSLIVLQSDENAQESMLPLVYKPQTGGDANADFNEQFEAA